MKTDVSFRSDLQNYDKFINELFSRKKKKKNIENFPSTLKKKKS